MNILKLKVHPYTSTRVSPFYQIILLHLPWILFLIVVRVIAERIGHKQVEYREIEEILVQKDGSVMGE
jgi:TctA family transporter